MLLVEGPSDMLAARSAGCRRSGFREPTPGEPNGAGALTGRDVTVAMDCDPPGRDAAQRIARDLEQHAAPLRIVDLAPQPRRRLRPLRLAEAGPTLT